MKLTENILSWTKSLEDPMNPLLGPTLKGLYFFGLWQTGSQSRTVAYNIIHFLTLLFVVSEFVDLHSVKDDINQVLNNMSLAGLSTICFAKCYSYVSWQNYWRELVKMISEQELVQIKKQDPIVIKRIKEYTTYARVITYLYWGLVFLTNLLMLLTPFLKYASSKTYRDKVKAGTEPYPQIICSWLPFDKTKMPGYMGALFVHITMSCQGSGVIGAYDMNAIAILCYLKGQMKILKDKCESIFECVTTKQDVLGRIRECHRHHNVLIKQYKLFDSLLSPTMFLYVFMCSFTICCSVVQFNSKELQTSQKLWVVEFASGLVSQLFLYCWHGNEVTVQSIEVDRGVYESEWWKGDVRVRKQLVLLAGKLTLPFVLHAGPYTTLSIPTFVDIIKGSYSFYTLFSQMQSD